jgi:hypothetical protein
MLKQARLPTLARIRQERQNIMRRIDDRHLFVACREVQKFTRVKISNHVEEHSHILREKILGRPWEDCFRVDFEHSRRERLQFLEKISDVRDAFNATFRNDEITTKLRELRLTDNGKLFDLGWADSLIHIAVHNVSHCSWSSGLPLVKMRADVETALGLVRNDPHTKLPEFPKYSNVLKGGYFAPLLKDGMLIGYDLWPKN